jgi:hypothetical protein
MRRINGLGVATIDKNLCPLGDEEGLVPASRINTARYRLWLPTGAASLNRLLHACPYSFVFISRQRGMKIA